MSLITPDSGLLFWMVLIFAIVFLILAKFGFPVITGMVNKRQERIQESIRLARKAEKELSEMTERQAQMMEQTRREQAEMLKEASRQRDEIVAQAREQARAEADRIVQDAKAGLEEARQAALRDIRAQVAEVSVGVAEKILRESLSSEAAQRAMIDRLVGEAVREGDKS